MTHGSYMGKDKMDIVVKGVQTSLGTGQNLPDFGNLLDDENKNELKDNDKEDLFDAF